MIDLPLPQLGGIDLSKIVKAIKAHQFRANRLEFYEDFLDGDSEMREYCQIRLEQIERRNKPRNPVLQDIVEMLEHGKSVAKALEQYIPASDIVLIAANESRGTLKQGITQLAEVVREEQRLRQQAIRELAWPMAYLTAALLIVTYGVPTMVGFLQNSFINKTSMTLDQRLLVNLSDFMSDYSMVFNVLYIALPILFVWSLPRWGVLSRIPGRRWADQYLPPYAIYRTYQAALFLRTLGAQISVTPKLEPTLASIRLQSTKWLGDYISLMEEALPLNRVRPILALDVGLLEADMIDSLDLVSRRGESERAITLRAKKSFDGAIKTIARYISMMRTFAILLLGVALAWSTFSLILQPMRTQIGNMMNPSVMTQGER